MVSGFRSSLPTANEPQAVAQENSECPMIEFIRIRATDSGVARGQSCSESETRSYHYAAGDHNAA